MIVDCCFNNVNQIESESTRDRIKKYIRLTDGQLNLEVKRAYFVYGILFRDNAPWYYICPNDNSEYPKPFPADLFEIIDDNVPDYWKLSYRSLRGRSFSELVIPEWADDKMFYENLVDGSKKESEIFKKYFTESESK